MGRLPALLFVFLLASGCSVVRAQGTWSGGSDIGTLVTAGAMVVGVAFNSAPLSDTLCDENDPPHTCPLTTPGPSRPTAPR